MKNHSEKEQFQEILLELKRSKESGPRMLLHHPILAIRHLLSEKRTVVDKPQPNASNRHIRLKNGNKE